MSQRLDIGQRDEGRSRVWARPPAGPGSGYLGEGTQAVARSCFRGGGRCPGPAGRAAAPGPGRAAAARHTADLEADQDADHEAHQITGQFTGHITTRR